MSSNTSKSHHAVKNFFGSSSTCTSSKNSTEPQLQTYTDHYGLTVTWVEKKKDFVNASIYTNNKLGSVGYIMVDGPRQLGANNTTIDATTEVQPWSMLYEK